MPAQSKRKQAELFMQYPPIWEHAHSLFFENKPPEMNIRVTGADTTSMYYRLDEILKGGGSYQYAANGKFAGMRGIGRDLAIAVDRNHEVVATLHGKSRIDPVYVKDIFSRIDYPDMVEYVLVLVCLRWHKEPTEQERSHGKILGPQAGASLDAYILKRPLKTNWLELRNEAVRLQTEKEQAYLHPPKEMPKLDGLEQALKEGGRLHAFCSGGGLRVVTVKKRNKLLAYGEHPDITEALRHASEDFLAGGRNYKDVYGSGKLYPHYLTGSSTATSNLDLWILQGHEFQARATPDRESIVVRLKGYKRVEHPKGVEERARNGEVVRWEERGFTYESFPQGRFVETKVIAVADGVDPRDDWMYYINQSGTAPGFWQAALAALEAEPVPVKRS